MAAEEYGTVLEVSTINVGTVFAADTIIGTTVISLADVSVFEELGGQVYIAGNIYTYQTVNFEANTMTLLTGLVAAAVLDETRVEVYPPAPVRTAMVGFAVEEGEAVRVTIPHFFSGMPDGVRPAGSEEIALVEERAPGELHLKDVMSKGMILLGPGENLDNYTSAGNFMQLSNIDAAGGTNYPIPYAGVLEVLSTVPSDVMMQRYSAYRNAQQTTYGSVWMRTYGAGVWQSWVPLYDDTGWITTLSQIAVASSSNTLTAGAVRRIGKTVHFSLEFTWGSALGVTDLTGNVADTAVATMVAAYRPGGSSPIQGGLSNALDGLHTLICNIDSAGLITALTSAGTQDFAAGETASVGGSYLLA